ncbi:glycosyltransferase family 2 protein [Oribacterium sp. P6A1]|uniref:glycosyltransferase family 2 protein n=1 Tax=Oribacterium sp. P6A1 TaxID=1410612 RepID=UPI0005660737|nr:glycosyltransferase family 2 protein [Oribacterium sp. P6A1]
MKVLAGIVLFNPDIERLKLNIGAIFPQVDGIVCVDNGSANLPEVKAALPDTVVYLENAKNKGIAAALNQILAYATENGYEWFITLDQDSVCEDGLVAAYRKNIDLQHAAILTCKIIDRNFDAKPKYEAEKKAVQIDQCITSASFCKTKVLNLVGGFDEKMFIDSVDFDICLNLRAHGYKIYRIPYVGLLHEVGHGRNVNFLGKQKIIYNQSVLRNYYIARNHVYMAKKYPQVYSMTKVRMKEIESRLLILLYESNKMAKLKARRKGLRDGMNNKMGECTWF